MSQTKLYIFTTSDIPDPYINVIAHCVANFSQINQVILIGITEDRGKINLKQDELSRLKENINSQLNSLGNGKYRNKKGMDWEELDINIETAERRRYKDIKDTLIETKVFSYIDLESEIINLLNNSNSCTYIFDVTAVLKTYLVDIYSILRFHNVSTIYSFELFIKRYYDQRDLIHNLTYTKTYDFKCLAETSYTRDRIVVNEE